MVHPHVVGSDEVEALSTAELLAAVQHDPQVVLTVARRRLADTTGPTSEAITLWWVIGLAERERGDWAASRAALERALDLAGPGPDGELVARLATSLAFVVAHDGDFAGAMWLLDAAEGELRGRERAKLRAQRGVVRLRLGQLNEAVDDLTRAATALARTADAVGEARARVNLGAALTELGQYAGARRQLERAVQITATVDVDVVAANAHHNLAWVATIQGDTPVAIHHYLVAEQQYAATGAAAHLPRLYADHARALADANLLSDAARLVARALELARTTANVVVAADLGITAAEILLVQGDAEGARRAAEESARLLRDQGRLTWALMADRAALEARARGDDAGVADALVGNAEALIRHGWRAEALHELLLAADVELRAGRLDAASTLCARVGRQGRTVRQVDGILAARVEASLHEARHDRPAARRAVSRGLRRSAELQAGLGSMEVRAHAAAHGADLAELGARLAVADGRPMELLERIESTRLITSRTPLVRPPDDESMATLLAELRQVTMALADPEQPPDRRAALEARRARVEDGVRRNGRMARVDGRPTGVNIRRELRSALTQLGTHQLLAHARLDDRLLAVTIAGGRSHLDDLGPIAPLRDLIDTIGFGLHRLNRSQGSPASRAAAVELVEAAARDLGDLVLPGSVRRQDSPLVVVPTGLLHGVAWRAIPQLAGREVVVSPSITAWATSAERRAGRAVSRRVGFVAGPDLAHAAGEVQALARRYRDPIVAVGADATSERLRALLGSCDLVHIACHGAFRADNPLFSTLRLVDGPMNVYDLERARRMPRTVVLSACSVGSSATLHGDRLLGVASALIDLGAASIVAPLSPVDDAATPAVMATLHLHLSAGLAPARALARLTAGAMDPTAAAFIALGA